MVKTAAESTTEFLPLPTPTPQQPKTSSLKTVEDIRAAVALNYETDYQGKTEMKGKFKYVPWDRAADLANTLFGVDGYDVEVLKTWREDVPSEEGNITFGYAALVRLTVHVLDNGQVRHIVRDGMGFNEMEFTKATDYPDRKTGEMVHIPPRAMIDASIKGAVSGGLLRALVLLGNAFGLYLYDAPTEQASTYTQQGSTTTTPPPGNSPLSPAQAEQVAKKFNTTLDAVYSATAGMTREQLKPALDKMFGGEAPWKLSADFGGLEYVKRGSSAPTTGQRDRLPIPV